LHEAVLIGLKAIAGGSLVVAFAFMSDRLQPKTLAGLFSGAPSVALASLAVTAAVMGAGKAGVAAHSMIAGAAGMVAFCGLAIVLEQKVGSITASALAWLAWAAVAGAVYLVLLL
jgi:hypothetical protein